VRRSLGVVAACDVERGDQQILGSAEGLRYLLGVATGGDGVSGGKRGLRDLDAHATAGAGDEPNLLVRHASVPSFDRLLL